MNTQTACELFRILSKEYPDASYIPHDDATPFEILVLTILSAQTTDRAVEGVRERLFSSYPTPGALAAADPADVEDIIHSTGFFRMKAKHIISAARMVKNEYNGTVPDTMDKLLRIPGVGRKTANIVLFHAFGKNEGVAVDTHVFRLAGRIGFSRGKTAEQVESDLMQFYEKEQWGRLTDLLIAHGRSVCDAKKPLCEACIIRGYCRYYRELPKKLPFSVP
jgi:endonuclease-3